MNVKDYEEKEFDALLNKTIILSSKKYYKKQMTISNNESLLINKNDEDIYSDIIDDISLSLTDNVTESIEEALDVQNAVSKLSAIEQAVIFLAFGMGLTQVHIARLLKISERSVRRFEYSALEKMKKILEGGD